MVVHAFNTHSQEAEAGLMLRSRLGDSQGCMVRLSQQTNMESVLVKLENKNTEQFYFLPRK